MDGDESQLEADTNTSGSKADQRDDVGKPDMPLPCTKPTKQQRLTSRTVSTPESSLEILDACLPLEPPLVVRGQAPLEVGSRTATVDWPTLSPWLRHALFRSWDNSGPSPGVSVTTTSLTARIIPLTQRMRSLLFKRVYAKRRSASAASGTWSDEGRPVGFLGAGLGEELALAVFGRIQSLKTKNVGKQVCVSLIPVRFYFRTTFFVAMVGFVSWGIFWVELL